MSRQTSLTPTVNPYTAILVRRVAARLERRSSRLTRTSTTTTPINHADFQNSPVSVRDDIKTIVEDTLEYARYKHKPITVAEAEQIRSELNNLGQVLVEMVQERQNQNNAVTVEVTKPVAETRCLSGRRGSLGPAPVPSPKQSGVTGSVGAVGSVGPSGPYHTMTLPDSQPLPKQTIPAFPQPGHTPGYHSCCGFKCSTQDLPPTWPKESHYGKPGFILADHIDYHPCCGYRCSTQGYNQTAPQSWQDAAREIETKSLYDKCHQTTLRPFLTNWSDPDQFVKNGVKRNPIELSQDPSEDLYSSRNLIMPQPELLVTPMLPAPLVPEPVIDPDATLFVPVVTPLVTPPTESIDLGGWTAIDMPNDDNHSEPEGETAIPPVIPRPQTPYTEIPASFAVKEPINLTPYCVVPDATKVHAVSNGPFTTVLAAPEIVKKSPRSSAGSSSANKGRSHYNDFMKAEIARIKSINPAIEHKVAFKQAAANWSGYKVITSSAAILDDAVKAHIINSAI